MSTRVSFACFFFFFYFLSCTSASPEPGFVTVRVESSNGNYLGETSFEYYEEPNNQDVLRLLVHDPELQQRFFKYWVEGLSERQQKLQPPSNVTPAGTFLYQWSLL